MRKRQPIRKGGAATLYSQKKSPKTNDLIWGINTVFEFLKNTPDQIAEISIELAKKSLKLDELIELAKQRNIKIHSTLSPALRQFLQDANHQGVIAKVKPYKTYSFTELKAKASRQKHPVLLVLDSIQDQHNLGAIIRTASAAGVAGIILPKDRSAPLTGTTAKVSAGALSMIDICMVTNLSSTLLDLKNEGYWIYGADLGSPQTIYHSDFSGPICLVIGGESKGIRPLVKKQCDFLITIPMHKSLDSLNASVAAAVILFEIIRQQQYNI